MKKWKGCALVLCAAVALCGGAVFASDNGRVDFKDYFRAEGAELSIADASVDVVLKGENAKVSFLRNVTSSGFSISFSGVEGSELERADIILTDASDESCSVKLSYVRMNETYTAVALNDSSRSYITNGSLYKENDSDFYVTYEAASNVFTDSANFTIPVATTSEGEAFTGFKSQVVKVTIELQGKSESVFRLKEINRQRFGKEYENDNVEPMITVVNGVTEAVKGQIVNLPTAFASDVLQEIATVKMTVKDPDGNIMKAVDGTNLSEVTPDKSYQIKIDAYGSYRIEYQATDGINMTRTMASQINVVDASKPRITLSQLVPTSGKLGETLVFPTMEITDNMTEAEKITSWITVKYPCGKLRACKESVVLSEAGQYTITFHAMDEEGNIGTVTQKIYVEGE